MSAIPQVGKAGDPRYGVPRAGLGPVVWCRKCSRKHRRRAVCKLFLRRRKAKSGDIVLRWCH